MKKNLLILALLVLGFGGVVLAAPTLIYQRTVLPETDNTYDLGTTTARWRNVYAVTASSTNLIVSGLNAASCDVKASTNGTFSCGTDSTGSATFAWTPNSWGNSTSTILSFPGFISTASSTLSHLGTGGLAVNNGLIYNAATSTLSTITGTLAVGKGGTGATTFTSSQLLYGNGTSALSSVATSSETCSSPLSCTAFDVLTGGGSITLNTVPISKGGTNQTSFGQGWLGITDVGTFTSSTSPTFSYFVATSTTATSTFMGNAHIVGNLRVDGNFFAPVTLIATSDTTINGKLTITGAVDLDTFTSAILLTGAGGDVAEYTGSSCTNQFVRSLSALGAATCATVSSADVSLAELTATNSTLTFSGTYNGSTARTIGLNVGNANNWTALQTFTNATSTQMSIDATGRLYIPAGANPTIGATGDIAINTTAASTSIRFYDGTAERSAYVAKPRTFTFASSTVAYYGGTAATTTIPLGAALRPETWLTVTCYSNAGTGSLRFGDGTNYMEYVPITTTASPVALATNNTFIMSEKREVQIRQETTVTRDISCSVLVREDSD